MTKIQANDIINYLNTKWGGSPCPMCHSSSWNLSDKIFELREFNNGSLVLGGPSSAITPVIPVTCTNCGNTIFVNALTAGFLKE